MSIAPPPRACFSRSAMIRLPGRSRGLGVGWGGGGNPRTPATPPRWRSRADLYSNSDSGRPTARPPPALGHHHKMEDSPSRSALVRAACQSGAWLEAEVAPPPTPPPTTAGRRARFVAPAPHALVAVAPSADFDLRRPLAVRPRWRRPAPPAAAARAAERLLQPAHLADDVKPCATLKVLYARSNKITDLKGASALTQLQSLDLECNALSALDALAPLWSCQNLGELRLRGNLLPYAGYKRASLQQLPLLRSLDGSTLAEAAEEEEKPREEQPQMTNTTAAAAEEEEEEEGRSARLMTEAVHRWKDVSEATPALMISQQQPQPAVIEDQASRLPAAAPYDRTAAAGDRLSRCAAIRAAARSRERGGQRGREEQREEHEGRPLVARGRGGRGGGSVRGSGGVRGGPRQGVTAGEGV